MVVLKIGPCGEVKLSNVSEQPKVLGQAVNLFPRQPSHDADQALHFSTLIAATQHSSPLERTRALRDFLRGVALRAWRDQGVMIKGARSRG